MDIRVIGGGAAALAFGATGYGYVGMDEVLTEEIRHVSSISAGELQGYMDSIVTELSDGYDYYSFEAETYAFVGELSFSADARTKTFKEAVRSEDVVSDADRATIKADIESADYCASNDAQMFTQKGYNYSVDIRDGGGTRISYTMCSAAGSGLRS